MFGASVITTSLFRTSLILFFARSLPVALLLLAAPVCLHSQLPASTQISGVVSDPTGAAIAAAEVTLSSGSFTTTQTTDNHGEFVFSQISVESSASKSFGTRFSGSKFGLACRHEPA